MLQDQKKAQDQIERQKAEEKLIASYLQDNEKVRSWLYVGCELTFCIAIQGRLGYLDRLLG